MHADVGCLVKSEICCSFESELIQHSKLQQFLRTMRFSDIPAHEQVKVRLRSMVDSDRIPHALLLQGPSGIGKLSMARALAQYIHCTHRTPDGDSCGTCPSCRQHQSFNHVDTIYVYPVIGSRVSEAFSDDWHEFVSESMYADVGRWADILNRPKGNTQPLIYVEESTRLVKVLAYTSRTSDQRIVILWLPERMQPGAANKLLKMVEEPYENTLFIMVSNSPSDILPTIYSRLQRVEMHAIPDETVARLLECSYGINAADAEALAHVAEGSMAMAQQLVDGQSDRRLFMDWFVQLMRLAYQRDVKALRDWGAALAKAGREKEIKFYDYASRMIRENFMYNFGISQLVFLDREEAAFSSRFARFITERNAEGLVNVFEHARTDIAGNANGQIVNLDVAVKTILLIKNG